MSQRHNKTGPSPQRPARYARPSLEGIEGRIVPSSAASLSLGDFSTDHILVRFKEGQTPFLVSGTNLGGAVGGLSGLYKVNLGSGVSVTSALTAFRSDARVRAAEPDFALVTGALPNDEKVGDQWAWNNKNNLSADIDASQAWSVATGSTRMIVSVMDTGVEYTHPDLYQNIWVNQGEIPASRRGNLSDIDGDGLITLRDLNNAKNQGVGKITDLNRNGYIDAGDLLEPMEKTPSGGDTGRGGWANGVSDDRDLYVDDLCGWNLVDNDNDPIDDFGHGTHVAGTIGAVGNNGYGVTGVNWAIQMMPIKFMNANGAGSVSSFIDGLNYAIEHGAKISNNSWTGSGTSDLLEQAVAAARAKQHIVVAAAGNSGADNDKAAVYPSGLPYDNVVAVAATDRNDKLATFSNYGAKSVDLAAPGVDILSTTLEANYGYNSGTSMATPHVSGAMALVWAKNPTWTYKQVIDRVLTSVDKIDAVAGKTVTGGRLNIGRALGVVKEPAYVPPVVTPPTVAAVAWSGPTANSLNKVRVTFDRAMALSSFTAGDVQLTGPKAVVNIASVVAVSGSGDKVFDITFATQTEVGTYSMRVGPEVTDVSGKKMTTWTGTSKLVAPALPVVSPEIKSSSASGTTAKNLNKVRVTFDRAMVASSFSAADVKITGPSGQAISVTSVQVVGGRDNKTFDINFPVQTALGNYTVKVGPEVTDASFNKMKAWTGTFKLTATNAEAPPAIVSSTASGTTANNLSKARVTFDRTMDVSSFSPADVVLTAPSGKTIPVSSVQVVGGTDSKTFDVNFPTQTAPGSYSIKIGPEVTDRSFNKMKQWTGVFRINAVVAPAQSNVYAASTRLAVAPNGKAVSLLTIEDAGTITDVEVKLSVTHPRVSDLMLRLQAPDGTIIVLSNRGGVGLENLVEARFADGVADPLGQGDGPFRPLTPLAQLNGKAVKGTWKLWVEDRAGARRGTFDGWSMTVKSR